MNRLCTFVYVIIIILVIPSQDMAAQSVWDRVKQGASDVWNSETVEKVKNSETVQKVKNSKVVKKSSEYVDSKRYTVPITRRSFINIVPNEYLLQLSNAEYQTYLKYNKKSTNTKQSSQVRRVAQRLTKAAEELLRDNDKEDEMSMYKWEINLVTNKSANAFCLPGGKIVVYDGILPIAQDDASLAIVIGHEIAHAIAQHSAEQLTKRLIAVAGTAVIYSIINGSDMNGISKSLAKIMASAGITWADLKNSRKHETEADRLGMILAAMAGYNPEAAIGFWERMAKNSGRNSTHDWYSDHPSDANRVANVKSFLSEAKG